MLIASRLFRCSMIFCQPHYGYEEGSYQREFEQYRILRDISGCFCYYMYFVLFTYFL